MSEGGQCGGSREAATGGAIVRGGDAMGKTLLSWGVQGFVLVEMARLDQQILVSWASKHAFKLAQGTTVVGL